MEPLPLLPREDRIDRLCGGQDIFSLGGVFGAWPGSLSISPAVINSNTHSVENRSPFVSCVPDRVPGVGDALQTKQRASPALMEQVL